MVTKCSKCGAAHFAKTDGGRCVKCGAFLVKSGDYGSVFVPKSVYQVHTDPLNPVKCQKCGEIGKGTKCSKCGGQLR